MAKKETLFNLFCATTLASPFNPPGQFPPDMIGNKQPSSPPIIEQFNNPFDQFNPEGDSEGFDQFNPEGDSEKINPENYLLSQIRRTQYSSNQEEKPNQDIPSYSDISPSWHKIIKEDDYDKLPPSVKNFIGTLSSEETYEMIEMINSISITKVTEIPPYNQIECNEWDIKDCNIYVISGIQAFENPDSNDPKLLISMPSYFTTQGEDDIFSTLSPEDRSAYVNPDGSLTELGVFLMKMLGANVRKAIQLTVNNEYFYPGYSVSYLYFTQLSANVGGEIQRAPDISPCGEHAPFIMRINILNLWNSWHIIRFKIAHELTHANSIMSLDNIIPEELFPSAVQYYVWLNSAQNEALNALTSIAYEIAFNEGFNLDPDAPNGYNIFIFLTHLARETNIDIETLLKYWAKFASGKEGSRTCSYNIPAEPILNEFLAYLSSKTGVELHEYRSQLGKNITEAAFSNIQLGPQNGFEFAIYFLREFMNNSPFPINVIVDTDMTEYVVNGPHDRYDLYPFIFQIVNNLDENQIAVITVSRDDQQGEEQPEDKFVATLLVIANYGEEKAKIVSFPAIIRPQDIPDNKKIPMLLLGPDNNGFRVTVKTLTLPHKTYIPFVAKDQNH